MTIGIILYRCRSTVELQSLLYSRPVNFCTYCDNVRQPGKVLAQEDPQIFVHVNLNLTIQYLNMNSSTCGRETALGRVESEALRSL